MIKNPETLQEKDSTSFSDLTSTGIGAAVAGPVGAAIGLGANKLFQWARNKYLDKQKKNKNKEEEQPNTKQSNQTEDKNTKNKKPADDELKDKVKKAQDDIMNSGMFEPEVYETHKFYKSTIYDERDPENNNFVYISKAPNTSSGAYKSFLDYWTNKWAEEREEPTSEFEKQEYRELVKDRFPMEADKECLITVPQYFLLGAKDVLSMAKNSDIEDKEGIIYYDKPSFDSNFAYDTHMSKYRKEDAEQTNADEYKTSLITFKVYGRNYVYAFDLVPGVKQLDTEAEKVILNLGQELTNDAEDSLYAFTRVCEQMIDDERKMPNIYTVAAPLFRKDSTNAEDLEYNATLLDSIGIYESEEEFIENYLEDYQKLLSNQMKA